jgi:hypothetical protein
MFTYMSRRRPLFKILIIFMLILLLIVGEFMRPVKVQASTVGAAIALCSLGILAIITLMTAYGVYFTDEASAIKAAHAYWTSQIEATKNRWNFIKLTFSTFVSNPIRRVFTRGNTVVVADAMPAEIPDDLANSVRQYVAENFPAVTNPATNPEVSISFPAVEAPRFYDPTIHAADNQTSRTTPFDWTTGLPIGNSINIANSLNPVIAAMPFVIPERTIMFSYQVAFTGRPLTGGHPRTLFRNYPITLMIRYDRIEGDFYRYFVELLHMGSSGNFTTTLIEYLRVPRTFVGSIPEPRFVLTSPYNSASPPVELTYLLPRYIAATGTVDLVYVPDSDDGLRIGTLNYQPVTVVADWYANPAAFPQADAEAGEIITVYVPTNVSTLTQASATDVVADMPDIIPNLPDIPFKPRGNLLDKFPFSIPFDLYHAFGMLLAPPVTPYFKVPFRIDSLGFDYDFELDLGIFDGPAKVVRWGILIGFNIWLIIKTRDLMRS